MSQNLLSAAVVIGALRVKLCLCVCVCGEGGGGGCVAGFQVGPTFPIFPTFPYFFDLLLLFPTFS